MNEAARPRGFHVLLVEDHAMLRGIMEQTLVAAGLQVTVAESGDQAAVLLAAGAPPDVLLSDIRMRGKLNGKDLARWAKQRYPSMVILLQTGFGDIDDSDFRVLRKPFGPDVLLDAIRDAREGASQLLRYRQ
jgi:two-component system cell cycle sensor histidine kinase/response regulator CckA